MLHEPTVFVLGAGASYGDTLVPKYDVEESPSRIPLINQFFDSECMFDEADIVERDYSKLLEYIRKGWGIRDDFGSGKWRVLNLEDVFTHLAIDVEFASADTDQKSDAQLKLSALKTYIGRSICNRSIRRFGKFTQQLVEHLRPQDSIITFNYDQISDILAALESD